MKTPPLTRAWRLARLLTHLLLGLLEAALLMPRRDPASRARSIGRWSHKLCRILGVIVHTTGHPPAAIPDNTILVANHVSWLDIFVMNAGTTSRFVAKAEVRDWPVLGWLCERTGTLFVTRERRHDTRRVNQQIAAALAQGDCIAVFPEGGTSDGMTVGMFNASLLQPAVDAAAKVIPVALRYYDHTGQRTTAAAYVGDMSLLESMLLLLAEPELTAELTYLPSLAAAGSNRRELAAQARGLIADIVCAELNSPIQSASPAATAPETPRHPPV